MTNNYKRSDFVITYGVKIEYLGTDWFERPKNLTKYDMACILEKLHGFDSLWTIIYDAFTKRELVVELTDALNKLHDDDYLISDDLLDEANDHYNHFV